MSAGTHVRLTGLLRGTLAAVSAALIFVLGLAAVSPRLHQQLHQGAPTVGDDQCAIVLFANGVSAPATLVAPPPPAVAWQEPRVVPARCFEWNAPRYRLLPERGPPVS